MTDQLKRLHDLFGKYASGDASAAELQEFWQLVATHGEEDFLSEQMQQWWGQEEDLQLGVSGEKTLQRILSKMPAQPKVRRLKPLWAAAAAIIIMAFALFYFLHQPPASKLPVAKVTNPSFKNDVMPGVTGATLTLADGTVVPLDSAGSQLSLLQGGTRVAAVNGTISYNGAPTSPEKIIYNTLTTRRGQQYPLRLSDGSLVILDAGSTITYPVGFPADKRKVQVHGQAWFEIAADAARPFIVKNEQKSIVVLGTSFNVKAYEEADLEVTLVAGSVRVSNGSSNKVLLPGQQAVLSGNDINVNGNAAISEAIAWKDGNFEYKSRSLTHVMQDVARWYDIDIVYEGAKPTDTFTGGFSRTITLTELLTILEMSRIHFKLEGRKLTVLSR
ncbi:FecR family protein [Chitinophaga jiangningensis]|uniref:FecR family protein n=1 Tax=Chitinophaga jiangningensis TaxID=1419482 RepID=A0A1M7CMG1_9BACT|nr:FecR family protein [Chitinophaga jiangningensis]SHL68387.1 FecR family protein [Chitinophaga jiangningensis]